MSRARDIANYGDGIDTASITSGTLADARIPNLATSKITSGTFADARIAQSNVTQHESAIDALGTVASGTFNGTLGSTGFPFTSGYQNIGAYRFLYGSGYSLTNNTASFTSGGAGTFYYESVGLRVSLTGFASILGINASIASNYVDVMLTFEPSNISTSSIDIRPCSPRNNSAWNGKLIYYFVWGTPS